MNEPDPYEDDNHKAPPKLQIKDIKVDVKVYETEKTEGAEEDSPKGDNPRVYSGIADAEKDLSSKQLPATFTDGGSSKSKPKQKFNQASTAASGPSHEPGAETQTKGDQSSLFVVDKTIEDKPRHALLIALLCFKEHPVFSRTLLLVKLIDLPLVLSVQGQIPLSTLVVSLINFCATLGLYALIRRQITLESRWILFQILLLGSFSVCLMVVCYQVLVRIAEVELPLFKVPFLLLSLVQTMIWLGQNSLIYYIAGRAAQREAQSRNGPAYNQRHDESSIDNHSAIMGKSSIPIEGMVPISKASAPINLVPALVPSVQTSSQFNTDTTEIQGTKGQNLVSNDSAESTERQARKVKRRTKAPERLEPAAQDSPPVQIKIQLDQHNFTHLAPKPIYKAPS